MDRKEKLPKALYRGSLPIGNLVLDCAVLDNEVRILTRNAIFQAFGRTDRGLKLEEKERVANEFKRMYPEHFPAQIPSFLSSISLLPLLNDNLLKMLLHPIKYTDGTKVAQGYDANILFEICNLYLEARRQKKLSHQQEHLATQAEILLTAFAKIGIVALVDEATGYQKNRKSDALRLLLEAYLADEIKKWVKEFPDDFFFELDRLYGNTPLKANKRPMYYGKFINKYVYDPLENGKINPELQKRYKDDHKRHRKHQHFTEFGSGQLRIQIGKILGLMQVSPTLDWFKRKQSKQGQLALFPDFDDEQ